MRRFATLFFALALFFLCGDAGLDAEASPAGDAHMSAGPSRRSHKVLASGFPQLGIWWPDPREQPLGDIARWDYVVLGDWCHGFVQPLRELNPDIILLNSTNGCEVAFNAGPGAPAEDNEAVRAIPPQWFLTQVGSVLTQAVDASDTLFRVEDVTVSNASGTFDLFRANEAVLVGGETVWVEAVDAVNRTLTVRRGYVRPAAPHAAGTRLAAHITFWPGTWVLNLSTLCPQAVAEPTAGEEIWADYNARRATALLGTADWDGIMMDRAEPDASWLIGYSSARTIDPDQSNRLPVNYTEFDQAWNEGLRRYEAAIRAAAGPESIICVNQGMANYDLLNGNNFETFPRDDTGMEDWHAAVFGPYWNPHMGSYFEWLAAGRDPKITMIQTYEDDSGSSHNPCNDPGFIPDYRKMRFGLATALLNDGFFAYEISTNGHASLCLLWFDEYDNAGKQRGYLGRPLGPARRALPPLTTPNLAGVSTFEQSFGNWTLWFGAGYQAAVSLDGSTAAEGESSARIDVTQAQGTDWKVSFVCRPVEVETEVLYTLSFWAKADQPGRMLTSWVQQDQSPWRQWLSFADLALTTEWQYYEVDAVADGSDTGASLRFGMGQQSGSVWLDDIKLQQGCRRVWRRDYARGIVLVNGTPETTIVPLGGEFRKIAGGQAPEINDGSLVDRVTLAPFDGLILLRTSTVAAPALPLLLLDPDRH